MPFATSTPAKKHGTSDDSRVSIELDETAEHENMLSAEGGDNCTQTTSITLDDEFTSSQVKRPMVPDDSGVIIELNETAAECEKMLDNDNSNTIIKTEESDITSTASWLISIHSSISSFFLDKSSMLKKVFVAVVVALCFAYFAASIVFHIIDFCPERRDITPLVAVTCVGLFLGVMTFMSSHFGHDIQQKVLVPVHTVIRRHWNFLKWVVVVVPLAGIVAIIIGTVYNHPRNLLSLAGLATFFLLLFIFSAHPTRVNWRPVIGGFILQFYFAALILKWEMGYNMFRFMGEEARKFLAFTDIGSRFVFGDKFTDHIFVMQVLPVVMFFSCVITMLYHLGIMQAIIGKIALVMRCTLGTTAAESLCAAGNIFVGQTEAPIMIRPFLSLMTKSELHAVMVGGFATIAGGVLAAYIKFGIPAEHLLCASVMNAPCSLAVSKLLYPETEKSKISNVNAVVKTKGKYSNLLEAAAAGASQSIALVANIAANLIAFIALLAFANAVIAWLGGFVCLPDLSFEKICHYLLMPLVYLMGVRWEDAGQVAELIAVKTFLNEFVAYEKLSVFIKARNECNLDYHILSPRSVTIATYALCGFSNLSSIGIMLGGLGPMAPDRTRDMAHVVVRALFGGVIVCLITACTSGLLVPEASLDLEACMSAMRNETLTSQVFQDNVTDVTLGLTTINIGAFA
ncbi:solute carrier family 28 member 3-like isoform X2 [Pomacea canaliculata]|uniref:solute carrier family 28 member 3-like isoform X2 n=1 Tax=Pomacea canaliculata TaxID=400727 RepID=UPI000D72C97B|nr:solute carrier family 28 member 3-like isoform X2 [Pomacea canaliculata]